MTIPRAPRQSFVLALESQTSLAITLTEIRHDHLLNNVTPVTEGWQQQEQELNALQ